LELNYDPAPTPMKPLRIAHRRAEALNRLYNTVEANSQILTLFKIKSIVKTAALLATQNNGTVDSDLLLNLIDLRTDFKRSVEGAAADDTMNAYG
jgi:hypothetical protein